MKREWQPLNHKTEFWWWSDIHSASSFSDGVGMWESEKKTRCRKGTFILLRFVFSWFVIFFIIDWIMGLRVNVLVQYLRFFHWSIMKMCFYPGEQTKLSLCAILNFLFLVKLQQSYTTSWISQNLLCGNRYPQNLKRDAEKVQWNCYHFNKKSSSCPVSFVKVYMPSYNWNLSALWPEEQQRMIRIALLKGGWACQLSYLWFCLTQTTVKAREAVIISAP